jgi:hypothetical protein
MARNVGNLGMPGTARFPEPPTLQPAAPAPAKASQLARPLRLVPHRLTPAERHRRISDLAYRRAEQRGFASGNELEDWLEAEREVDAGRY